MVRATERFCRICFCDGNKGQDDVVGPTQWYQLQRETKRSLAQKLGTEYSICGCVQTCFGRHKKLTTKNDSAVGCGLLRRVYCALCRLSRRAAAAEHVS